MFNVSLYEMKRNFFRIFNSVITSVRVVIPKLL